MAVVLSTEVISLDPNDIDVGERVGIYWPEKAAALGELIRTDGQRDPIKVRRNGNRASRPWRLVTGLHRLAAIQNEQLPAVLAIEVSGDEDELRAIEVSENLHRRDLGPIERAMHLRVLADLAHQKFAAGYEGLTDQQIGIRRRWDKIKDSVAYSAADKAKAEADAIGDWSAEDSPAVECRTIGWQEDLAAGLKLKPRQLRDYLKVHRTLVAPFPNLGIGFAQTPIASQLKACLAVADIVADDARAQLMRLIIDDPSIVTVDEAKVRLGLSPSKAGRDDQSQGQTAFMERAEKNLDRLSASSWRDWAPALAAKVKPSALIAVRDALNARIAAIGTAEGGVDDA